MKVWICQHLEKIQIQKNNERQKKKKYLKNPMHHDVQAHRYYRPQTKQTRYWWFRDEFSLVSLGVTKEKTKKQTEKEVDVHELPIGRARANPI